MKRHNLILLIVLLILLFCVFNSIPATAQSQKQVRITDIKFEGKGKATITGKTMDGSTVILKYGFHGGMKGKPRYTNLVAGTWLTIHEFEKMKGRYRRCRVQINS